ncbi:MAG: hypothetical protein AB7Q42_08145 [Acidimicrobiia bacterium]
MTPIRVAQLLGRLLAMIVLVASGTYFIVYLYRWEWNRAQISGLIFVATELSVLGALLLRRLGAIESRLAQSSARNPDGGVASPPAQSEPPPAAAGRTGSISFPWLDPSRTSVFIPVLLGAGAVLSALAYVIERMAMFVVGERTEPSVPLERIAYPAGGLLADSTPERPAPPRGQRWARAATMTIVVATAALMLGAAIDVLADATESRPDPTERSGVTEVTVHIGYRTDDQVPVESTAQALFESCRLRLPGNARLVTQPHVVEARTVAVTIEPALGPLGIRRLGGCLEDMTLDGVRAELVSVRHLA